MRMAAVFTLSVSTVALRTATVHRGIAFSGYAVALVLLLVAGRYPWAQLVFPGWVLVLSIAILVTPARTAARTRCGRRVNRGIALAPAFCGHEPHP